MPKLVTWMNNQRVGELTKLANGAHTFKYAPEWLASRYARPLSLSLPLQRGNITSDAVFNFFDNLLPDSPIVRDRIVKRYHAKSRQPFDLLSEIGRDSVGAVTLIPEDETVTHPIMAWESINNSKVYAVKMNGQTVGREGARNLGEVRTGVEAKVNNNLSLWGNVGVQLGDKGYSDTQGMLGVKYSW